MQVEWEDQERINEFSKLNTRFTKLIKEIKDLKENKEDLEDLKVDVELVDDDDMLSYHFGEFFAFMRKVDISRRVDRDVESLGEKLKKAESQKEDISKRMSELKETLYAKFGRENINLERE